MNVPLRERNRDARLVEGVVDRRVQSIDGAAAQDRLADPGLHLEDQGRVAHLDETHAGLGITVTDERDGESIEYRYKGGLREFVKFMTSPEGSLYLSTHTGYVPIYKDALDWPEMQAYLEEHALQQVPAEGLEYSYAIPVFSALGTSDGALRRAVESVELQAATPQEALDEAKKVVDKNIAEQH